VNTESQSKTERLAKISRVLGILSFLLTLFPLGLFTWERIYGPWNDEFSMLGWAFLAVFMMLGGLLLGIPGCITALIALKKNMAESNDPIIRRVATTGLVFSLLGVVSVLAIIVSGWIFTTNNPPPDMTPPMPSTTVP
jgi:hypothetical protein